MSSDIPFESIELQKPLGPIQIVASERAVRRYCDDWDDHEPMYLERSIWGGPVVPPAFQAGLTGFQLLATRYNARATIGARSEHRSIQPALVGASLITTGSVVEKYVRRGLEYVIVESRTRDENDREIRWSRDHILLSLERRKSPAPQDEPLAQPHARVSAPAASAQSGATAGATSNAKDRELPRLRKRAYQRALDENRFASNSIHNDDYTRQHGYAGALMSAYVLCGYMSELLVRFFGPNWMTGGWSSVNFINGGVQQGDLVTCGGEITDIAGERSGTRHDLDIWMEKSQGQRVIAGKASGTIARS